MRSYILRNLLSTRKILCESFAKNNRVLTYSQLKQSRQFSSNSEKKPDNLQEDEPNLASPINMKYKIFDDKDADVIFDVSEEQQKIKLEELRAQETFYDRYADINLNRKYYNKLRRSYEQYIARILIKMKRSFSLSNLT